jgi:hypothetical protein
VTATWRWVVLALVAACSGTQHPPAPWTTDAQAALVVAAHAVDALDAAAASAYTAAARDAASTVALDAQLAERITARNEAAVALTTAQAAVAQMVRDPSARCAARTAVHLAGVRLASIGALMNAPAVVEATSALAIVESAGPTGCVP